LLEDLDSFAEDDIDCNARTQTPDYSRKC